MAGLDAFKAKFGASDTLPNVASSKEPASVMFDLRNIGFQFQ